jgi:NTP pyrophosphatase (non-canonical NTP hydrolase)
MYVVEVESADTLSTVQRESREWRAQAYPETRGIELQALGVCEEAGELAHAVLKYKQGIRGYDREKTRKEVADAIGDIVIYACGVADQLDIDVSRAVYEAWEHVRDRNITQGSDAGNTGVQIGNGNVQTNNFR